MDGQTPLLMKLRSGEEVRGKHMPTLLVTVRSYMTQHSQSEILHQPRFLGLQRATSILILIVATLFFGAGDSVR